MYETLKAFYERVDGELAEFTAQAQAAHQRNRNGWKARRLSDIVVGLMRLRGQFDNLMPAVVSDAQAVEHGD